MNSNGYQMYQATRAKSSADQREIDRSMGELAASFGRRRRRPRLISYRGRSAVITSGGASPRTT
ncbi:MAG TPA: hypothetical protein VGG16_25735 [Streptosporangiaceae bacterium]|jgi:hypothetical protein